MTETRTRSVRPHPRVGRPSRTRRRPPLAMSRIRLLIIVISIVITNTIITSIISIFVMVLAIFRSSSSIPTQSHHHPMQSIMLPATTHRHLSSMQAATADGYVPGDEARYKVRTPQHGLSSQSELLPRRCPHSLYTKPLSLYLLNPKL